MSTQSDLRAKGLIGKEKGYVSKVTYSDGAKRIKARREREQNIKAQQTEQFQKETYTQTQAPPPKEQKQTVVVQPNSKVYADPYAARVLRDVDPKEANKVTVAYSGVIPGTSYRGGYKEVSQEQYNKYKTYQKRGTTKQYYKEERQPEPINQTLPTKTLDKRPEKATLTDESKQQVRDYHIQSWNEKKNKPTYKQDKPAPIREKIVSLYQKGRDKFAMDKKGFESSQARIKELGYSNYERKVIEGGQRLVGGYAEFALRVGTNIALVGGGLLDKKGTERKEAYKTELKTKAKIIPSTMVGMLPNPFKPETLIPGFLILTGLKSGTVSLVEGLKPKLYEQPKPQTKITEFGKGAKSKYITEQEKYLKVEEEFYKGLPKDVKTGYEVDLYPKLSTIERTTGTKKILKEFNKIRAREKTEKVWSGEELSRYNKKQLLLEQERAITQNIKVQNEFMGPKIDTIRLGVRNAMGKIGSKNKPKFPGTTSIEVPLNEVLRPRTLRGSGGRMKSTTPKPNFINYGVSESILGTSIVNIPTTLNPTTTNLNLDLKTNITPKQSNLLTNSLKIGAVSSITTATILTSSTVQGLTGFNIFSSIGGSSSITEPKPYEPKRQSDGGGGFLKGMSGRDFGFRSRISKSFGKQKKGYTPGAWESAFNIKSNKKKGIYSGIGLRGI